MKWYFHWLELGFNTLETRLANNPNTGLCCFGDTPSLADICLVPQVYNAVRFNFDLAPYPTIQGINQHCLSLKAFAEARPEMQPDAH
jgi:maleylpyruvate isomerase